MSDDIGTDTKDDFVRVTFHGGRFEMHSAPVETLAELVTIQKAIIESARSIFKQDNVYRKRVPRGFLGAGRLYLSSTEHNCFSVTLKRDAGQLQLVDAFPSDIYDRSREGLLRILSEPKSASTADQALLRGLVRVGERLEADEWMVVARGKGEPGVRVDAQSRRRLAAFVHAPLHQVEDLEGEVIEFHDGHNTFVLRVNRLLAPITVRFERHRKDDVLEALEGRPAVRVRVRGLVEYGAAPKMNSEDLDLVDHERRLEIEKLRDRLIQLQVLDRGWNGGDEAPPDPEILATVKDVISRLIAENSAIARPKIFPCPEGGEVQAEWMMEDLAIELRFGRHSIDASAYSARSHKFLEFIFSSEDVSREDTSMLSDWIAKATKSLMGDNHV